MKELKRYGLLRSNKRTGKVDMQMDAWGKALLDMWALQNTPKSKITIVYELDTLLIADIFEGTADGFPKVRKSIESEGQYAEITKC